MMNEAEKQRIIEHPCVQCDNVYYNPPHPRLKCGVDGHTAIDILGLGQCLDSLLDECPKLKGGQ